MRWLNESEVLDFINRHNYDVRISKNARWIDQKCAADVVSIIADCIDNFVEENGDVEFTSRDIWHSKYSVENVQAVFKKVDVNSASAENEYDKFFQQPMKMFAYSGILKETKRGRENIYSLQEKEILQYLALREKNALYFLSKYIEKVLIDSNIWHYFENFFKLQSKDSYDAVKKAFSAFTIKNTAIGQKTSFGGKNSVAGVVECNRIFIKVLNPLAYFRNALGTERGHISKNIITYDMLMYNRDNFRDIYAEKPKSMARKDYMLQKKIVINNAYYLYQATKAKKQIKLYNDIYRNGLSEIAGSNEKATQIHHIFLASEYPEISYYLENLIALTPDQHYIYAHPNNNTTMIDKDYQFECLVAKNDSIKNNILHEERVIYSFGDFRVVLTTGLSDESFLDIEDGDYNGILVKLQQAYSN